MPEAILTVLKFCLLALLYLFVGWVARVVARELRVPAAAGPAPSPVRGATSTQAAQTPARKAGRAGGRGVRVLDPPELRGRTFVIGKEITIGRAGGCDITLADDSFVSHLHARLYVSSGETFIEDLGSTNGTYLNDEPVRDPAPVREGDLIRVGKTALEVVP